MKAALLFFGIVYCTACGQLLQPTVIASAGASVVQGNVSLSWTLGETFTETFSKASLILTQGFHQPALVVTGGTDIPEVQPLHLDIFPNPASNAVSVAFDGADYAWVRVSDMLGREVAEVHNRLFPDRIIVLDVSTLPTGVYLLSVATRLGGGNITVHQKQVSIIR